jgi:hypothetical protein
VLKIYLILSISLISLNSYSSYIEHNLDYEEPEVGASQGLMLDRTKDALLSFDYIENRADYFIFKLKNLTLGEYTDDLMYIAPALTGNVELRAYNMNVYYNHFQNRGGIRYKLEF